MLQNLVVERFSRDERAADKPAADIAQGRGKPEALQEHMDAVDTERAAEAARKRRPGSKTAADSSLAERFKPRCAVGQPTSRKTARHSALGRLRGSYRPTNGLLRGGEAADEPRQDQG